MHFCSNFNGCPYDVLTWNVNTISIFNLRNVLLWQKLSFLLSGFRFFIFLLFLFICLLFLKTIPSNLLPKNISCLRTTEKHSLEKEKHFCKVFFVCKDSLLAVYPTHQLSFWIIFNGLQMEVFSARFSKMNKYI